jgi:pilus assembly protein CpaC
MFRHLITVLAIACLAGVAGAAPEAPKPKAKGLVVPINSTRTLTISSHQNLRTVTNTEPNVARVTAKSDDPTSVLITGLRAGVTHVTLTDVKDSQEVFDVVVQTDLEHLRSVLRQLFPTANLKLVPASENTIGIGGTVERVEDIDPIVRTAQSVGGFQIVNSMHVGGVNQVQLCVTVAKVDRKKARLFGFNFLFNSSNSFLGSTVGNIIPQPGAIGIGQPLGPAPPQLLQSSPGTANIFGGVINNSGGFLGFLQALETEGVAKIMAEPRLVTMSGKPASFVSGGETPVIATNVGTTSVTYKQFGTVVRFLPIVLGNGRIFLEVEPEVSQQNGNVQSAGIIAPAFITDRVRTTVELEDGQTFAIGGLIQRVITGDTTKVPWLGQLPFLGALFSTKTYNEEETELVILVTPHLVDAMSCDQVPKILPGLETRSPDDFELFLEGILEAPRGPRDIFPDHHYVPAYKNGPTAGVFPCAGCGGGCGRKGGGGRCGGGTCGGSGCGGTCGGGGCGNGTCGGGACGGGTAPEALPAVQHTVLKSEVKGEEAPATGDTPPLRPIPDPAPASLPPAVTKSAAETGKS